MSLRIVTAAIASENADQLHVARLLLLLRHAADRGDGSIDGITKLAKMDFLVRYPVYLERVLNTVRKKPVAVDMRPYERDTVESKMIRFRYGPWDHRYRRWIALLVAKGLADTFLKGRTVHVRLTEAGRMLSAAMAELGDLADLDARARLVAKSVGAKSGTWLKNTIYQVVPELTGMAWGEEIDT